MIKMKSGIYGLPVKHSDGRVTVKGVGPAYGPFSLAPDEEKRLVDRGVAVYVLEPAAEPAEAVSEPATDAEVYEAAAEPIGFDEVPELPEEDEAEPIPLDTLSAKELREMCAEYGISVKGNASKATMIEAIAAAQAAEAEDDGEPAPEFDASEAVL